MTTVLNRSDAGAIDGANTHFLWHRDPQMTDFERARKLMVDNQLRTSNVTDRRLLTAMGEVPRERFVAKTHRDLAYFDGSVPQTTADHPRLLPAPAPFAKLVQLAAVGHDDRVLDLGCGSGYSTAVLARLAGQVTGVEADAGLAKAARSNLAALGVSNAAVVAGTSESAPAGAGRFDVIVIEGGLGSVPENLFDALEEGGRLVVTISNGVTSVAHIFVKSAGDVAGRAEFDARLPTLAAEKPAEAFVF